MIQRNSQKVFGTRDRERKIMLVGRPDYTNPDSCRNIPGVTIDLACNAHVHELLHNDYLIFTREGLKQVEEALKG